MKPFDFAQAFIERAQRAKRIEELSLNFESAVNALGFGYFACGSHIDPLHPAGAVMLINYPSKWVQTYSEERLDLIDPVFLYSNLIGLPFHWDDPRFQTSLDPKQRRILQQARQHGLAHGYTIPFNLRHTSIPLGASCSVVPDGNSIAPNNYFAIWLMSGYLFERAARLTCPQGPSTPPSRPTLTGRQRGCLELAAQGKHNDEIATILGISPNTAHDHIKAVMRIYNVRTRQEAILLAIFWHQIALGDVIRPAAIERPAKLGRRRR